MSGWRGKQAGDVWRTMFYHQFGLHPSEANCEFGKPRIPYSPHACAEGATHHCNDRACLSRIPYQGTLNYSVRWNLGMVVHG